MRKLLFLVNPNAGQRRVNKSLTDIIGIFNEGGYEVTVFLTNGPGSGTQIVQERAKDYDLVVCAVGYIPCGSTNDFASTLKLSTDVVQAAKDIMMGAPVEYDVGRWGDRYFVYIASFGAFTRVSYTTPQNLKNALGHLAYVLSGLQELPQIRNIPMAMELDGQVLDGEYLFGAVSNSTSVGGVFTLDASQVDLRDGKFEVFLVRMPRDMAELTQCAAALQNHTYDCAAITFRSVSRLRVHQDPALLWTLDGERAEGADVVEIENLHRAIRLVHRQEEP